MHKGAQSAIYVKPVSNVLLNLVNIYRLGVFDYLITVESRLEGRRAKKEKNITNDPLELMTKTIFRVAYLCCTEIKHSD